MHDWHEKRETKMVSAQNLVSDKTGHSESMRSKKSSCDVSLRSINRHARAHFEVLVPREVVSEGSYAYGKPTRPHARNKQD